MYMLESDPLAQEVKKYLQNLKANTQKEKIEKVDASRPAVLLRLVDQASDKGASSWLNAMPLEEQGLVLNKQEFRDSLRLRYNMPLSGLPNHCACGDDFNTNHALSCKKGGLVAQRHDGIRDLLTTLLAKVCKSVESEPHLLPLDNEQLDLWSTNSTCERWRKLSKKTFFLRRAS